MVILVLGGAKSGKSAFALRLGEGYEAKRAFVATAQALDQEMAERIQIHKIERADRWDTFEEPLDVADLIRSIQRDYEVILIDCLTLWTSNVLFANRDFGLESKLLIDALRETSSQVIVVSNEVGLGIVPENRLARQFRDYAGTLNSAIASLSEAVYFVVAGIPLKIK